MAEHCDELLEIVTKILSEGSPHIVGVMNRALDEGSVDAARSAFAAIVGDDHVLLAEEELAALPGAFAITALQAWCDAHIAGKPFVIVSESPANPIDAARMGRVAWRTIYDNDGVTMIVSHVHGHHAEWMNAPDRVLERRNHAYTTPV